MISPEGHLAEIRAMTQEQVEAIERRLLIEAGRRYGFLYDSAKNARESGVAAAIATAKENAKEGAA